MHHPSFSCTRLSLILLILVFSSQGRKGHSISVIKNGSMLVACGGESNPRSCISWRAGQDDWTDYATLRCNLIILSYQSLFRHGRYNHAAVVLPTRGKDTIFLIGGEGGGSRRHGLHNDNSEIVNGGL